MEATLAGAGEMGLIVRSIDWPTTSLGPLSGWSQALRTMAGLLLRNRFPMILWWGPEFVQLYNDAYRPMLGEKHPRAVGQPARECFAEIWDILGPMIEAPLKGQPATWSDDLFLLVNRKGFPEETHFKVAYSPVPDETVQPTGIGGVLGTIAETTDSVLGERQLRTLRELGAQAAEAKTPIQACEMAASTFRGNPSDLPFALLYLLDAKGDHAQLASACGFGSESGSANPSIMKLREAPGEPAWPLDRAVDNLGLPMVVANLQHRFDSLPTGRWSLAPHSALILPLKDPGQPRLFGFLIAGVNPHRELDEGYRTFFELAAAQIATAIRNATARQEEGRRAEALAELDRSKTVFFTNVSHEFRTPLTLMLGPLDDLAHAPLTASQLESVSLAQRNGRRLLKLVNTLLEFSRIEAGRVHAAYEPTDLALTTADLASVFRSAVEHGGLRLRVDCAMSEPVYVDREMWEKIVLNLLSNALKFTLQGAISVVLRQTAGFAELVISDTGAGIPLDQQSRVFDRFHRVEGTEGRSQEGSGIGLALVQELVKLHGGSISVQSVQGKGSAFTVRVPLGKAHLPEERIVQARPLGSIRLDAAAFVEEAFQWTAAEKWPAPLGPDSLPAASPLLGDRILMADDNNDMRAYLKRTLESRWIVEAVAGSHQALEAARANPPALVITDVMMPGLDGFGLLRALREDPATAHIPVILLSARAGEEALVKGRAAGADDYISKPFSARELIARVQTQLALARLRRADRAREEELQRLFMAAPFFSCRLRGPTHVFLMVNHAYEQLVGQREFIGRPIRDALPELAGQGFFELVDTVYRTGEAYIAREMLVRLGLAPGGPDAVHYLSFNYLPARDADGKIDGVICYGVDVTETVESRQRTEDLSAQLVLADRRKDEFLAMLGHELRNPLAPIATAVTLMELKDGDRNQSERKIIERQVTHLSRLIDDLLDVSRIAQGKIQLAKRTVDLSEVAARAVELASPIFESKSQQLTVQVPRERLYVDGDPGRLAQVIANLLTNAGKYTQARGHIALTASREGKSVVIKVKDDGIGIAPGFLSSVFELFMQSPQAPDRAEGGLGLGLALVRNLVALHGGEVTATSEGLNHGSEFVVRLPAVECNARTEPGCLPPGTVLLSALRSRKILVVDDNVDAAEVLAEYLTALGHEVAVAYDGPSALLKQATFQPDIGVLDLGLPVMDGYELATRMRQQASALLRLVALTGYGQDKDRQRSRNAGFDAHLIKPVDLDALSQFIAHGSPPATTPPGATHSAPASGWTGGRR